ncbi:MAG: TIGR02452 family protein [Treponema sp.]|nr:TIGR02452 family protein [Treponema sp.]
MDLIEVFSDTQKMYNSHPALIAACEYSRDNQVFISESQSIECDVNRFKDSCNIKVSKKRTFEAAEEYVRMGQKVAVLNFANSYNAGGGVLHGSRAQEECLCRISTLYDSLISPEMQKMFYEPHCLNGSDLANDDIIYTPKVTVFKTDSDLPMLRPESEWFSSDVLTCAAPCLGGDIQLSSSELEQIHTSRATHILDSACKYKVDVLILGAFGCGAFSNPPEIVADVYKKVLAGYAHAFKTVEFAIYCKQKETKNFQVFNSRF